MIQFYFRFGFNKNHFALHAFPDQCPVALRDAFATWANKLSMRIMPTEMTLNTSTRLPEIQVVINKNVGRDSSEASVGQKKH
jgi:hypothetical protein